jgi:hypothetical protein
MKLNTITDTFALSMDMPIAKTQRYLIAEATIVFYTARRPSPHSLRLFKATNPLRNGCQCKGILFHRQRFLDFIVHTSQAHYCSNFGVCLLHFDLQLSPQFLRFYFSKELESS